MATENKRFTTTIEAGADYSGSGEQYHAIALVDGQLANTAEEATGILLNKPQSGEWATVGYFGEMKFAAGEALSKGDKITVATSGWFTKAESVDTVVGEVKADVTSGSKGTGLFDFPSVSDPAAYAYFEATVALAVEQGTAYALQDNKTANNGREACGVAVADVASGGTGRFAMSGKTKIRVADATSAGEMMTVTTSGYFTDPGSGDFVCARLLANTASGQLGDADFFQGWMLTTSWANV